jgi:membrane-associated protease RseP (regulator of RpoE activity)
MRTTCLLAFILFTLFGCAYPRRETHMTPAPPAITESAKRPDGLWTLRVLAGETPDKKRSGMAWDTDGTAADPFLRLYVNDRLVWESEVKYDSPKPAWNITLPRNLLVTTDDNFRLEMWDRDTAVDADPMGRLTRLGLPSNAMPDAQARLSLEMGTSVEIMVSAPTAHRGVGLYFELHKDALVVLEVEPRSPAGRAGLKPGDRIVGVGPERVKHMTGQEASSQLSLASERGLSLTVADADGKERQLPLDKEPIWLVM